MKAIRIAIASVMLTAAGAAHADGDAGKGSAVFLHKCTVCHSLDSGINRVGPSLFGVIDQRPGSLSSFTGYTDEMKAFGAADHKWDDETLTAFLTRPRAVVPRTNMTFAGIRSPDDIADLIAYLKLYSRR
jgi:cytochrome c